MDITFISACLMDKMPIDKFDPQTLSQLVCLRYKRCPRKDRLGGGVRNPASCCIFFVYFSQCFLLVCLTPLVYLTAYGIGGTDFISKPYSPAYYYAKLNAIVKLLVMQKTLEISGDARLFV